MSVLGITCVILTGVVLLVLAIAAPRNFLAFYVAVLLLLPMNAGLEISPDLPIIFFSRPLILIGIAGVFLRRLMGSNSQGGRNPLVVPLLIILFGFALSIPRSVDLHKSLFRFVSLIGEWLGFAYLAWEGLRTRQDCHRLVNWLFLLFFIICLLGLVEFATGFNLNQVLGTGYLPTEDFLDPISRGDYSRIRSTFPHSIDYGAALTMLAPLLLVYTLYSDGFPRLFYALLGFLVLVNLALAASTGPILGLLVVLYFMYIYNEGRQAIKLMACLTVTILMILIQSPEIRSVFHTAIIGKFDTSSEAFFTTAGRIAVLLAAWQYFQLHPIFGSGLNTWFTVAPAADFMGVASDAGGVSGGNENFYAQVLLETGIVGLACVLTALYLLVRRVRRLIAQAELPFDRALYVATFSGMAGFFVQAFTANIFMSGSGQTGLVFWLILACCLRYGQEEQEYSASCSIEGEMAPA